jgi:phage-related protein
MKIYFSHPDIESFIKGLDKQVQAKVLRTFDLLEKYNSNLRMPHSKNIGEGLFELRIRGMQEIRFIYTFVGDKIIVVLSGFIKKSNKIQLLEIKKAQSRKRQL